MSVANMDFQPIVHQQVTHLIEAWKEAGMSEEDVQETASQFFNMGLIAGQQVQQEGGIQPQGTDQNIPYTPESAERVVAQFLAGLNAAVLKAYEQRLPSQEKWQLMQNVAYHVFEQSKQAVVATLGQEDTPEVQISSEQINNWLGQTAVEALIYYITEHEKQHGPITRTDAQEMPDLLSQPEEYEQPYEEAPAYEPAHADQGMAPAIEPAPQPQHAPAVPEIHHKYAAVGLMLSSMGSAKQKKVLSAFQPDEQQWINQYRDPEVIARHLDLGLVAKYLRIFKEKMGQGKPGAKSKYSTTVSKVIEDLPAQRLDRLFQKERPLVRGYVNQFTQASQRDYDPYDLPQGVEESLLLYLHRNFPEEISSR